MVRVGLEVRHVTAGYGEIEILHDVNLSVKESEIVCIIGPNGSGKSTLLKTICGLIKPKEGDILVDGEPITGCRPHEVIKKGITYIAQYGSIFREMTVLENLEMGGYTIKDKEILKERIKKVFEMFPVLKVKKNMVANLLSGGEQRMLEIGRALILEPKYMLIDEPSIGLAPKFIEEIFNKIIEVNKNGVALILVEQNAHKALSISHRGFVLDGGKIRYKGEAKALLTNPKIKKLYLGG